MARPHAEVAKLILAFDHDSVDSDEDAAKVLAFDVLGKLSRLGFLNDQYFEAKKAEESGAAGNVVDLTKGAERG